MLTEVKGSSKNNRYYRHGRFAIPADSRAALDFYFRHLFVPHSRREFLLTPLAGQSSILGKLLFPREADKNGQKEASISPDYWASVLPDRLARAGINSSGDLKLLLLGDYAHSARGSSVAFVFDDSAVTPLAVAKIGSRAHRRALKNEFRTLRTLSRVLPAEMSATVPEAFDLFEDSEFTVLLESALPGSSVHFEMRRGWAPFKLVEKHFSMAFGWLGDFQRATLTRKISFRDLLDAEILDCFRRLQKIGGTSKAEDEFIDETSSKAARFENEEIPLAMLQGDFWTRNILVDGEQTSVLDWEHARAEGCPLEDALLFAISYGRSYAWRFGREIGRASCRERV